ncbi:MAG: diacylglycerol kinase [Flavobacteriaceae bacterium]|nr:diacylglycerol kinase [Flavobacteriaceae bacterium]|tara:strand:+ start:3631 stop:4170 length:540 start_codon:yes stop_codon:yes gene_type:complete
MQYYDLNKNKIISNSVREITIIAAAAKNDTLGKENKLIWDLPQDLKRFKSLTSGHSVIMGRKTFESMKKPLPNRRNIVITRNKNYTAKDVEICYGIQEALVLVKDDSKPFIIGGGEIYKLSMELADCIELTRIHHNFEGDTFFPIIPKNNWKLISNKKNITSNKNNLNFSYLKYIRKKR